jgi:hypothetical protein
MRYVEAAPASKGAGAFLFYKTKTLSMFLNN